MATQLTPIETEKSRDLWAELMTGRNEAREKLDEAPENIRAAILAASAQVVATGDEVEEENPFG